MKASGTDLGTENDNVQESAAQVPHSKTLLCRVVFDQSVDEGVGIVNAKVEEMVEKVEKVKEEVGEEVEAEMSEIVASGIDQVRERVFLI